MPYWDHLKLWELAREIKKRNRLAAFTLYRLGRFKRRARRNTLSVRQIIRRFWPKRIPRQLAPQKKGMERNPLLRQKWRNRER